MGKHSHYQYNFNITIYTQYSTKCQAPAKGTCAYAMASTIDTPTYAFTSIGKSNYRRLSCCDQAEISEETDEPIFSRKAFSVGTSHFSSKLHISFLHAKDDPHMLTLLFTTILMPELLLYQTQKIRRDLVECIGLAIHNSLICWLPVDIL